MTREKAVSVLMFFLEITKRAFCFFFVLAVLNLGKILIYYDEYYLQVPHYFGVFFVSLVFLLLISMLQSKMKNTL